MKICFLSGSNQPGRCGISDYISLLSKEYTNRGHEVEHRVIRETTGETNFNISLPTADLYSLQFAPYSFSDRGFGGKYLLELAQILEEENLQINFHEIWIGAYPKAAWKEKFIGWLQRKDILRFIKTAKPMTITCSNAAALERFNRAKVNAHYLYLFGNIPYSPSKKGRGFENLRIAIFGTPYANFPFERLAEELVAISQKLRKQVQFRVLGRQRDLIGLHKIHQIAKTNDFIILELGELSTREISVELQQCDLGLCTTPYDILGKSGAAAAILEHGLPTIAFDDGDTPSEKLFVFEIFEDQIFLLNDEKISEKIISFMQKDRKQFFDGVAHTAKEMLNLVN